MKQRLIAALALFCSPFLTAQTAPPTSISLEKSKTSLLSPKGEFDAPESPLTNFRLFLRYTASENVTLKFGDHPVELPAADNASVNLTYEHLPNSPALIHLTSSGDPTTRRIEIPGSKTSPETSALQALPGKDFPMDKAFTAMVRFKTTAAKGTLIALAPATGKWAKGGKSLFLDGGQLHYDVGWKGAINGGPRVNDGKEHLAILTADNAGKISLFLDGKKIAENDKLTSKDTKNHLFKIGATTPDFGGDFKKGSIILKDHFKRPF